MEDTSVSVARSMPNRVEVAGRDGGSAERGLGR